MVAVLATNQAKVHGMAGPQGRDRRRAPTPTSSIWDPDLTITATQANRHGNVDYTPYEGMTFTGGAGAGLPARDARLPRRRGASPSPAPGSFVHRTFAQPAPGPAVR